MVGYTSGGDVSPFTALADWKAAVKSAVKGHFAHAKATKQANSGNIASLTAAVALLRLAHTTNKIEITLTKCCALTPPSGHS